MGLTTDPKDPKLKQQFNADKDRPGEQNDTYLVLPPEELEKGFVRPIRYSYVHDKCGGKTTMGVLLAQTYARNPKFYGSTYCIDCRGHYPVAEFMWAGTKDRVGS